MSKQDFIDKLTNPTEFGLRTAINKFKETHEDRFVDIVWWKKDSKLLHANDFSEWHLELVTKDTPGKSTNLLSDLFSHFILTELPNARINVDTYTTYDEKTTLHHRTYGVAV